MEDERTNPEMIPSQRRKTWMSIKFKETRIKRKTSRNESDPNSSESGYEAKSCILLKENSAFSLGGLKKI
jgi:hypothetical protein